MKLNSKLPLLLAAAGGALVSPAATATVFVGWDFQSNPIPTFTSSFHLGAAELPLPTPPAAAMYDTVSAGNWTTDPSIITAPLANEPSSHVLAYEGKIDDDPSSNRPTVGFKVDVSSLTLGPGEFLRLGFVATTQLYGPPASGLDVKWSVEWSEDSVTYSSLGVAQTDGSWQSFSFDVPAFTSSALYFQWYPGSISGGAVAGYAGWDDVTLTVVPEPKVYLGATGLALAGFALWRRRAGR